MSKPILRFIPVASVLAAAALGASAAPRPTPRKVVAPAKPKAATPAAKVPAAPAGSAEEGARFFTAEVMPLLQAKCIACHSGDKPQGGLRLTTREAVLKGGASGPSLSPGKPGEGLLLAAVNYHGRKMPPQGKLPQKQIDVFARWVSMGAPWASEHASLEPKGHHGPPAVTAETKRFWSFQPVKRPAVPVVKTKGWVRNPIDAFVLKRLEAAKLTPNPRAGKIALIRRAYYDLIGLPPSPEAVEAFVADNSPQAWEKVVDQLLQSPQYGEKWGRHWLDLVRYAETNSYERDGAKPNAWRYRDYVIQSFNQDKPYDQFVTEQLAGDELGDRTPERLIATGYYRMGIWDDEPADPEQALYDDLDDIASTTSQVFLGMTVGCARCHDHKLDPIPQKDYYSFLSFFSGVRRYGVRSDESVAEASLAPIAPPEAQQKQREEVAAHQEKMKANREQLQALENRVLPDLTPVEKEEWRTEAARIPTVKKRVPRLLSQEEFDRYAMLSGERRRLLRFRPSALDSALVVKEVGAKPREMHLLMRGNPHAKGDKVEPGFLSVLTSAQPEIAAPQHGDTSGRRLALARWITGKENPLTARVLANRVWQYHFGRGIVRSTSNFGFQGDKPTHPELLDWLASEIMAGDWKLKPIHRTIMLSAAYQMASTGNPAALAKDPENNLMWRFDMRRLQAEEVRDSILAVNGSLNLKMAGPSIYPTIPAEVLAGQSRPGEGWGVSSPEEQARRSVYIFVKRSLAMPIIASFDGPETDFSCPSRFSTTQPTQALGMINSTFVNDQARIFAQSLKKQAGENLADQVRLGLTRTLQRKPTPVEIDRGVKFVELLQREDKASPDDALAAFCVIALNLNEFMYLD